MRINRLVGVAVVIVIAATLSACSQSGTVTDNQPLSAPSPSFTGKVPDFSGPWAAELTQAYESTTSDVVHKILAKGYITDQDYAQVSSAYVKCMANRGFKVTITGPAGEADVTGNGDPGKAVKACDSDMSVISALRYEMSRNPQHLDENTIVVACLVKAKIAPPSYTTRDYAADLQSQKFPFSTSSPGFLKCTSDPLGLSTGQ